MLSTIWSTCAHCQHDSIYYYQLATHTYTTKQVHVHKYVFHVHSSSYIHTCLRLVQVTDEWQGCWARNAKVLKYW